MRFVWLLPLLAGCGTSLVTTPKVRSEATNSSPFYVVEMNPTSGTVASLPASVTIFFNDFPNRASASALTHYNLDCGSGALAAADVDSVSGYSSVTVTLSDPGTLSSGSQCTFTVSSNVIDTKGNPLSGSRSVNFTIQ